MQKLSKIFHLSLILVCSMVALPGHADIWKAENEWNMEWEKKFSQWMRSAQVHKKLFTSKNSPYYGIKADCADTSYALRAIFSLENSLPFRVANPSGGRNAYNYLSNELDKFDRYGNEKKRLVAFINYLGAQVGTEHLSHYDTTPVQVSEISPGMIFTYKIRRFTGKTIRHSYNIKDITPTGNFDVIYTTQAIAKSGADMMYRKEYMFSNTPHGVWGFKRFKWPHLQNANMSRYPEKFGHSSEQYDLVDKLGVRAFFRYVKKTLQVLEETPEGLLTRSLNTLCTQAKDRVTYVNQAIEHMRVNGSRCMNYADYDAYSTPARDKALSEAYISLFANRKDVEAMGQENEVDPILWDALVAIEKGADYSSDEELYKLCSINYREGKTIHLAELYRRMEAGLLSSHPNDKIELRWGETSRGGTRCRVWY
ncbi:MAG: hypothetical protein CME63_09915 [Halobacteriovoraceae bacterium]|nr:hypothetical protein [Halobacteriovoraceae bacterium]